MDNKVKIPKEELNIRSLSSKDMAKIISIEADRIKTKSTSFVSGQVGYIDIPNLEVKARLRVGNIPNDEMANKRIKSKLHGVMPLLESGQVTFEIHSTFLTETHIVSSLLQPFGNAAEVMMYITFVLIASDDKLKEFRYDHRSDIRFKDRKRVYYWIEELGNDSLDMILRDYRDMRNLAAHTYQPISIQAAQSFIFRTYENIQRLELIINPFI